MREICTSGSEGGGDEIIGAPYPYLTIFIHWYPRQQAPGNKRQLPRAGDQR
jgi:hypothetical protein